MTTNIERLRAVDFEEALDVLNISFGMRHPEDFETLLPALYQPGEEQMSWNWALREDGRIRAIVGLFPLTWQLGDVLLRIGGIGGVACHPRARRMGYMQQLMNHCVQIQNAEGYQLSWLGGQRQRYGYYGYETCGVGYELTLNQANLRHTVGENLPDIRFSRLQAGDTARLGQIINLHDDQVFRAVRRRDRFYDLLCSWRHQPQVALARDGNLIGYLVVGEDGHLVTELVAAGGVETAESIALAWVGQQGQVRFDLAPWSQLLPALARYCEGITVRCSGNWRIFAWEETLGALFRARQAIARLSEGTIVLEITNYGRLLLEVRDGIASCIRTNQAPTLTVDAATAMRLLFGPLQPSAVVGHLPPAVGLLQQWCPLPLCWGRQDGV